MKRLVWLYPRWWREQHGAEFTDLVADLSSDRHRVRLALDIVGGALDARLHGGPGMRNPFTDPALRRGVTDGLIISGVLAAEAVLTNVVFPGGPDESDSDPEYVIQILAVYMVLAIMLVVIGARARRRSGSTLGGVKGGAAAGVVIAILITTIFLTMNNLFFDIVSQQHDKRVAFAASGWDSMRAYITVSQLEGALFLVPTLGVLGAFLGMLGGMVFRPRARPSTAG
jgi:hypothetical protein